MRVARRTPSSIYLIATPLITAGHVHAVMEIGAGRRPNAGASLVKASTALAALMLAIALTTLGTLLGTIALVVPGIYLYVRWYVTTQSIVGGGAAGRSRASGAAASWCRTTGGACSASRS